MKKTLLLAAALACSGAVAQEKEVWACQGVDSNGFKWENGKWERAGYASDNWLLSLDRTDVINIDGNIKSGEMNYSLRCRDLMAVTCASDFGVYVTFDSASGTGSVAHTFGSVLTESDARPSIYLELIQCTKF